VEQALADLNQAIALDPDFAVAYANRGNAYATLGEVEKAVADFERYLELAPNSAIADQVRAQLASLRGE
jgi:regulator of sirC expression with transglutaminase-like and TPR domain